ncbi:isoleucine--tRNA ligase [Leptotrichia sp. oral taxon 221]|uniref:isoleucine--tRNA ligase n=1 Tax=Leptotrichia sp. oral taxon 221 TaxID=712362 RepID=UPI001B8C1D48|nr:isoleucine--tRNA ligase [Leptotrichia sp. oral taxon 221]QUB97131.1 isoleucine--tRNA ligase [Leptotrichia sp. oral taxon 221]
MSENQNVEKVDYAKTLNLPKTSFKMKANLAQKEPLTLRDWTKSSIYEKSLKEGHPFFILHDGPPYANGDIHIGHAMNKVLKDIILKYKRLRGYNAPYIPGWDTHGLPIEWKIMEELGEKAKAMTPLQIRQECKKYALKWVEKQKKEFVRLGVLGDWDNPYITLKPEFEAEQLKVFKEIYENGYIYKGLKPVYWSPTTETALAEAEIEYKDVTSHSIYVKFEGEKDLTDKLGVDEASILIWTTTPWTLPANLGVFLHPEFDYGLYKTEKGNLVVAKDLAEDVFKTLDLSYELLKEFKGTELEYTHYQHPFLDRKGLVMNADYVTIDAGTGAVHTAPGHGADDYNYSLKYNIGILSPVDDKGHMTKEAGKYEGMFYAKASKAIVEDLTESGHMLYHTTFVHSYPHDWRSKKPVIFRATEQWFISVDESDIRQNALDALKKVEFVPEWGKNRINAMIETRPDWTISRQRVWGVPIPLFYNKETNEVIYDSEIMDRVIELVKKEGTDIWWKYEAKEIIGEELLEKLNLKDIEIRKERSIMDVWFDSGVSHRGVLVPRNLPRPADLYLEGSDQHRGWFQSSLLTSIASTKDAPYKRVLTHGFVMDGQGRKMSKSLGNTIVPKDIIEKYGADILRLWVSSVDYREDVRISENILQQMSDAYRRIRNTARFLMGNLNDFDYATEKVDYNDMFEIDKWAMHKLEELKEKTTEYYDKYEFYNLFQEITYFCSIEMSSFYLDIVKDRLYCEGPKSLERRSAQTVLTEVLKVLVRIISPVLSFTAEEIWERIPASLKDEESVHLASWIDPNPAYKNEELAKKWEKIAHLRKEVNKKIEAQRQEGLIGHSLDARVLLNITNDDYSFLKDYTEDEVSDLFIVSQTKFVDDELEKSEIEGVSIGVTKALGKKCERCWKYSEEVGKDERYPDVDPRCAKVLAELEG